MKIRYFIFLCIFTSCIYGYFLYIHNKKTEVLLNEQNKNLDKIINNKMYSNEVCVFLLCIDIAN